MSASPKSVCVYIGSRANYSSLYPVLRCMRSRSDLKATVVAAASAVVERFGDVSGLVEKDGFPVAYRLRNLVEGDSPETMAKTTGLILLDVTSVLANLRPDLVLVVGDRFDVLPVVVAAAFMNIRVAHTMGGETTGTIDESVRHAITKLAHYHFVANADAYDRVLRLGEDSRFVFNVGCPRNDFVLDVVKSGRGLECLANLFETFGGVGPVFSLEEPFILASLHPVTTEIGENQVLAEHMLNALSDIGMNTILLWPNSDAGSDEISKCIRRHREIKQPTWLHVFKNLPVDVYVQLLNRTACLVGNSSSGIREGGILGTPVVNIGSRQQNRLCSLNVMHVKSDSEAIANSIGTQLKAGRYAPSDTYGSGDAAQQICDHLAAILPPIQKAIMY